MAPPLRPREDAALAAELIERLGRLLRAERHAQGLNPVQWEALRYLARCNRFSNTPGALAAYLPATKGTVSQTLIALEQKGLIERLDDPLSARVTRLAITAAGRKLSAKDPIGELTGAIESIPSAKASELADTLLAVLSVWQAARGGKPFGICRTCVHFQKNAPGSAHWCKLMQHKLSEADSLLICAEHKTAA